MTHEELFGSAQWLGCDGVTRTPLIRASFDAPKVISAQITICGLGYFNLYINGTPVSDDLFVPATSDYAPRNITVKGQPFDEVLRHRCYCLQYDLAAFLREGRNELAVALGPGFFSEPTWSFDGSVSYGPVRVCYRITWTDEQGRTGEALSGADARWKQSPVTRCDFFRGEVQDLRMDDPEWTTADAADWQPVSLLAPLDTSYQVQDCPADKIIRTLTPRLVHRFPNRCIYDAGENITGWVILRDEGRAGDRIDVDYAEDLEPGGGLAPSYIHGQYLRATSGGRGCTFHAQFTWNGFRYFSVVGPATPRCVAVIHNDLPVSSAFDSSSAVLNWLYQAYIRTELNNIHGGIPSDCPHLERRGYTGDGQLTCETAMLTLESQTMMRKWLRDIMDCQDEKSGHVQYTAPYTRCGGGPGGWGCAIVTVPYAYYRQYGDCEPMREMHPGMGKYIEYLRAHSADGLVVSDRPGEWCLGDWCCPGYVKLPEPYVNTYFLIRSLDLLMQIESILGLPTDARWPEYRAEAVASLCAHYYDEATGDFCRNVQGANAFALDIGLGDARTLEHLVAHYDALGGYDTGIFGTEVVTRVLLEKGEAHLAFRLLTSENPASFAGWMNAGATTLWEYWPGDRQRSLDHPMFGAVTKELFYAGLGIRQAPDSAGWRKAVIAPAFTPWLSQASGHIQTPLGQIRVSYRSAAADVTIDAAIPQGMEATLYYAGKSYPLHTGENHLTLPPQHA